MDHPDLTNKAPSSIDTHHPLFPRERELKGVRHNVSMSALRTLPIVSLDSFTQQSIFISSMSFPWLNL